MESLDSKISHLTLDKKYRLLKAALKKYESDFEQLEKEGSDTKLIQERLRDTFVPEGNVMELYWKMKDLEQQMQGAEVEQEQQKRA